MDVMDSRLRSLNARQAVALQMALKIWTGENETSRPLPNIVYQNRSWSDSSAKARNVRGDEVSCQSEEKPVHSSTLGRFYLILALFERSLSRIMV